MRCHLLLVDRHYEEKVDRPKADLLAWYIDTTTNRCLRTYDA
jgi:hypothetical protein